MQAPIFDQQRGQIDDLGLAGAVLQHGFAFGEHGGHQDVFGAGDGDFVEGVVGSLEPVGAGLDVAVLLHDCRAELFQSLEMKIDGAGADGAAAGDGDARESHAGHQRAEDERGGAHGLDQLVAGFRIGAETGGADGGAVLGASVAEFDFGAHGGQQAAFGFDVAHLGNVFENDGFGGEQSGGHGRQRGVFSAADADGAEQRIASANDKLVHEMSPGRIRNEYEWRTTILHAPGMRCCDAASRLEEPTSADYGRYGAPASLTGRGRWRHAAADGAA